MATGKTYVQVNKIACRRIFDVKFKSAALKVMDKAVEKAVKASRKLTLDAPEEKGAKGWTLDGSLASLAPDKSGKRLEASCSMSISTWPGKSIKAMPSGTAAIELDDAAKADAGDVEAVAEGAAREAMKSAVKYMETTAP